jgi:hypothetical protein
MQLSFPLFALARQVMQLQRSDQEGSSLFSLSEELREHILGYAVATVAEFWSLVAVCKRWHSRSRLADIVYEDVRLSIEEWGRLKATLVLAFNARSLTLSQTNAPDLPVSSSAEACIVHKCFQADVVRLWSFDGTPHTMMWTHARGLNPAIQVNTALLTLGLTNGSFKWCDLRLLWQHLTHGSFPALQTLFLGGVQCSDLSAVTAAGAFVQDELDEASALPSSLRVCELTYVAPELLTQLQVLLGDANWQQLQPMIVDFTLSSAAACASSNITTAISTMWNATAVQRLEQQLFGHSSSSSSSSSSSIAAPTTSKPAVVAADLRRVVRYTTHKNLSRCYLLVLAIIYSINGLCAC